MGTVCKEIVLSDARGILFGEYDSATWNCFGLLCSMMLRGWEDVSDAVVNKGERGGGEQFECGG